MNLAKELEIAYQALDSQIKLIQMLYEENKELKEALKMSLEFEQKIREVLDLTQSKS